MPGSPKHVLFLCTGNSARSILAESLLNALGGRRFVGHSAGSHPNGRVHPFALELLEKHGRPTAQLRSKSWDEFAAPGAPQLDYIFTVCDNAAGEACPLWPGRPVSAHWGIPDPAAVEGADDDKRRAFAQAMAALKRRIELFLSLPHADLDPVALKSRLREIGRTADEWFPLKLTGKGRKSADERGTLSRTARRAVQAGKENGRES